jgi:hypothetical protein
MASAIARTDRSAPADSPRKFDSKPYPFAWNIIPLLACLADPILGVLGKVLTIFWRPGLPGRADSRRRRKRGLALVLGGIEGPSIYNYWLGMGLLRGGYRGAVVRFHWNAGLFGVRSVVNLMSRRHLERQSDLLARTISEHVRARPESPVCLLAQSGGCYVVLRALERLPADLSAHCVLMLAPSISPGYDLSRAASKCRASLISIGGPGDAIFLGLGTLLLGTSDRVFSPSAGFAGWHSHPTRFVESRWHPSWLRHGYCGNHISTSSPRFIAKVIAPMFRI